MLPIPFVLYTLTHKNELENQFEALCEKKISNRNPTNQLSLGKRYDPFATYRVIHRLRYIAYAYNTLPSELNCSFGSR